MTVARWLVTVSGSAVSALGGVVMSAPDQFPAGLLMAIAGLGLLACTFPWRA